MLALVAPERRAELSSARLRVAKRSYKVEDLMEVGAAHAGAPRDGRIETLRRSAWTGSLFGAYRFNRNREKGGKPTTAVKTSEGVKVMRASVIVPVYAVSVVRMAGWSKAPKSRVHAFGHTCRRCVSRGCRSSRRNRYGCSALWRNRSLNAMQS